MKEEFEALRASARQEALGIRARFLLKNKRLTNGALLPGMLVEYDSDRDHLYVTLGEPREGMALFTENIVFMADPVTLELVGFEILDFKNKLAEGKLTEWGQMASLFDSHPVVYIPSGEQAEQAQREITRELATV